MLADASSKMVVLYAHLTILCFGVFYKCLGDLGVYLHWEEIVFLNKEK